MANFEESTSDTTSVQTAHSSGTGPFLTVHTAVVLLAALFIGTTVGGLAYLSGNPVAGSVLGGLVGAGGSIPVLRSLIR
jgi:hypothetical protein